jgi:hypothetical protein
VAHDGTNISRRSLLKGAGLAGLGLGALGAGPAGSTLGSLGAAPGSRTVGADDVLRLARVWWRGPEEGALLATFDDTHHVFDDGSVEVLLWPGDLARLQATGMRHEVTVADVLARDARAARAADRQVSVDPGSVPGARDDYRVLSEYEDDLLGLVARFSDRARLIVMPERTLEGRRVLGIEIAEDVHRRDGRPVWYMDGLHHAREWPSGELVMNFAFELLENPENDERIAGLVRDTRTILVPVVNADGFSWSRGALAQTNNSLASLPFALAGMEAYWRKNRRGLGADAVVPVVQRNATAHGVDVNRNYSARWGGPGADSAAVGQTYRGPGPFSESEVRNVAGLLRERQPIAINSNHTYTGLILRPWGHTGGNGRFSPDEGLMRDLGAAMSMHNRYRNIHSIDLYATTGTTLDWAYAALGAFGYTFEIGFTNFHPAYAGSDGPLAQYRVNRDPFILLGETARFMEVTHPEVTNTRPWQVEPGPLRTYKTHCVLTGTVVDADGAPVAGAIPLGSGGGGGFYEEPSRATIATDADGTFEWHLPPSTTPTAKERGEEEAWTITVSSGGTTATTDAIADRGDTRDLGTLTLG